jgi:hypothetical protein
MLKKLKVADSKFSNLIMWENQRWRRRLNSWIGTIEIGRFLAYYIKFYSFLLG